jgi:MFS family permease
MGYIVAYCAHSWELFAMRSWLVAFLAFSLTLQSSSVNMMAPTVVATLSAFVAMVSSIVGNELADRYGRRRMITIFLLLASIFAFVIGFLAALPYWIIVTLALIYGGLIQLDSAALTAGAINAAEKGRSGSTLGLHALIGFSGAAAGPLVFGVILDLSGGGVSTVSWGYAFASIGIIVCFGPVALWKLRRHSLSA